jgi:hypothetical protein
MSEDYWNTIARLTDSISRNRAMPMKVESATCPVCDRTFIGQHVASQLAGHYGWHVRRGEVSHVSQG